MAGTKPITPIPKCFVVVVVFWRKGRLLCKSTAVRHDWGRGGVPAASPGTLLLLH